MGIAVSLVLIVTGAILVWAVNASVSGVDLNVVGWIALAVGAIGLLVALAMSSAMPWRRAPERDRYAIER